MYCYGSGSVPPEVARTSRAMTVGEAVTVGIVTVGSVTVGIVTVGSVTVGDLHGGVRDGGGVIKR
jgi:hypothetical protein